MKKAGSYMAQWYDDVVFDNHNITNDPERLTVCRVTPAVRFHHHILWQQVLSTA